MKNLELLKDIMPKFIRTLHSPLEPNASRDDLISTEDEWNRAFSGISKVFVEEKIDGSNCGMTVIDGQPIIRNRNHILNKSFSGKTPAKMQFSSIWTWYYSNSYKFNLLAEKLGFMPVLYGEWMFAQHSIFYNKLPDLFIVFDVYDSERKLFLPRNKYENLLRDIGFSIIECLWEGNNRPEDEMLIELRNGVSTYSESEQREGIYIKICNNQRVLDRFKIVNNGFTQGEHWNKQDLKRNKLVEKI